MAKSSNSNVVAVNEIDLLLIGKTGNGKSATGNSILLRQAFESSASMNSVTNEVNFDYTELDGRVIKVVDVRGVQDTRETTAKATALFIREMECAIVANPRGYHAFLIVLKYGVRFTKEEENTIDFLKAVFGKAFVKDHCIIVMTGGDMFLFDHRSKELTFKNWCENQEGPFKELLQECSQRIVLFNNRSEDEDEKKKQVIELLNLVDQLKGLRYTDDNFKQAELAQTELIMKSEVDDIRENVIKETSLILQKLKLSQESYLSETSDLETLLVRAEALQSNLSGVDKKTKLLNDLIQNVQDITSTISSEIKVQVDMREWKKTFADNVKNMDLCVALKRDKLTKEFSLLMGKCYEDQDRKRKLQEELNKELNELEVNLEKEKNDMESEFFNEIKKRREKLNNERKRHEEAYEKMKYKYLFSILRILKFPFEIILSGLRKLFKNETQKASLLHLGLQF